jgi:hypothetical protein
MDEAADTFDSAFAKAVDLGNRLAGKDKEADLWDIADGLLAGAIQYWLYTRQPCGDPRCEDCVPISTAEARMTELKRLMDQLASESEYFHAPTDANAGRAEEVERASSAGGRHLCAADVRKRSLQQIQTFSQQRIADRERRE